MSREIEQRHPHPSRAGRIALFVVLGLILLGARSFASYAIEVAWWKELGQFHTWLSMLYYGIAPVAFATLFAFAALWITHARALKFAGTALGEHRLYHRISTFVLLLIGYLVAAAAIDTWTVVDRKSTRLNSRHLGISYAVFCLKKKKTTVKIHRGVSSAVPLGGRMLSIRQ